MSFLVFMALLIVASVCIDAKNSIFDQGSRIGSIKNDIEKTLREKLTMANIKAVSSRLPAAVGKSIKLSTKSFLSSSAILFPVGLALNIKQFRPIDAWLMKGAGASIEWAKLGACFTGAETFVAAMRDKNDRVNAYLGSGVTSGLLRLKEGPVGIAQGFAVGYGFMYAIDQFAKPAPPVNIEISTDTTSIPSLFPKSATTSTARTSTSSSSSRNNKIGNMGERVVKMLPTFPKWK